jgi:hypothetical protein
MRSKVMTVLVKSLKNASEQRCFMLMSRCVPARYSRRDSICMILVALKRAVFWLRRAITAVDVPSDRSLH